MESTGLVNSAFAEAAVEKCYQCGKCTAGCPMAAEMDLTPNQVVRLAQTGEIDRVAACRAVWLCVSCFTCTARCPQSVDCAGVMDIVRQMAFEKGACPPELQRILLFQREFLDNVRRFGRVNEVELIRRFKILGFMKDWSVPLLFKDAMLGPKMMLRGKFHVFGEKVRDRAIMLRIFNRCERHDVDAPQPAANEAVP